METTFFPGYFWYSNNLFTTNLKQFVFIFFSTNKFWLTRRGIQWKLDIKMKRNILAGVTGGFAGNFVH